MLCSSCRKMATYLQRER
ncbi:hypothetical protein D5F51_16060 [Yersinia hibernica]|uniref:Uncharacterized protein n=1 Tax=Yersinia hibernica TaxID=2339259 RepID=A0ABX5R7A0_9GAMM|nr:hypothetical protein D5F51_16060 [Yersinia hibernica]